MTKTMQNYLEIRETMDGDTGGMLDRIIDNMKEKYGNSWEYYFSAYMRQFPRIYALALDYADTANISVQKSLAYTMRRLRILRHSLHSTKDTALDTLETMQGGKFSSRTLKVHENIELIEPIALDTMRDTETKLQIQRLLKNLFFSYCYSERSRKIKSMITRYNSEKKILPYSSLERMAKRVERITKSKTSIKPVVLEKVLEKHLDYIGGLI